MNAAQNQNLPKERGPVNGQITLPGTKSTVTFTDRGGDVRVVHRTPGIEEPLCVSRKRAREVWRLFVGDGYVVVAHPVQETTT